MDTKAQPHGPHPRMVILLDRIKYSTTQIARDQEDLARLLYHKHAPGPPALNDLIDPISCALIGGLLHKRPDNVLRTLKCNHCRVMKISGRWHCQRPDAAVLWPKLRLLIPEYPSS